MISALAFVAGSVPIVWWSRKFLLRPSSHGFPRFIAFEAILGLIVLNAPHWFEDPFCPRQLVSWLFLLISVVLVVSSVVLLRRLGGAGPKIDKETGVEVEPPSILVTTGVFRFVRHPMYSSLLFLASGALLKSMSGATFVLIWVVVLTLSATARAEETLNIERFGEEYVDYMGRTRRFVPFLF